MTILFSHAVLKYSRFSNFFGLTLQLFATVTIDEPVPGVKAIFSFTVPDQRSGKVRDCPFMDTKHACPFYGKNIYYRCKNCNAAMSMHKTIPKFKSWRFLLQILTGTSMIFTWTFSLAKGSCASNSTFMPLNLGSSHEG